MRNKRTSKGITLIALVITIIVLLILAGVSIAMLTGKNGILVQADTAREETKTSSVEEEIELIIQEAYIEEYVNETDRMEYLKNELLKRGAKKVGEIESYQKEYWKYKDVIIIINPNKYSINPTANTLINNEGNSSEKGFLVDISQGGIPRKDIESIKFINQIPENYTISYDVSESRDSSIMLYGVQNENNRYDAYIVANNNGSIYAPEYSARLFGDLINLKSINLENLNTSNATSMYRLFTGCTSVSEINLSKFDTTNVKGMEYMFYNCNNVKKINMENFNTSNVTSMSAMFNGCNSLTEINLENFDTSKVVNMEMMFNRCSNLSSLELSNFDTSNVTTMYYMFKGCSNLSSIDLTGFNTEKVTDMSHMFGECTTLTELNLISFNTAKTEKMGGMFSNCKNLLTIYVSKDWNVNNADTTGMFYNCGTNKVTIKP